MNTKYMGLLGLALASVLTVPAYAADWYGSQGGKDTPYVVTDWSGVYVGVNGGGGRGLYGDQLGLPGTLKGVQPAGGFGGLQAGYEGTIFGLRSVVVGLEADIEGGSLIGKGDDNAGDSARSRLDVFGTVRARVGYAVDYSLIYFTGGLAYGSVRNEALTSSGGDFLANTTSAGYVLGGGIEYRLSQTFSIKAEYQYINLGSNAPADISGNDLRSYVSNGGVVREDAYHTVRLGLNYHPF
jgi:outer membrane immunogenic protein